MELLFLLYAAKTSKKCFRSVGGRRHLNKSNVCWLGLPTLTWFSICSQTLLANRLFCTSRRWESLNDSKDILWPFRVNCSSSSFAERLISVTCIGFELSSFASFCVWFSLWLELSGCFVGFGCIGTNFIFKPFTCAFGFWVGFLSLLFFWTAREFNSFTDNTLTAFLFGALAVDGGRGEYIDCVCDGTGAVALVADVFAASAAAEVVGTIPPLMWLVV